MDTKNQNLKDRPKSASQLRYEQQVEEIKKRKAERIIEEEKEKQRMEIELYEQNKKESKQQQKQNVKPIWRQDEPIKKKKVKKGIIPDDQGKNVSKTNLKEKKNVKQKLKQQKNESQLQKNIKQVEQPEKIQKDLIKPKKFNQQKSNDLNMNKKKKKIKQKESNQKQKPKVIIQYSDDEENIQENEEVDQKGNTDQSEDDQSDDDILNNNNSDNVQQNNDSNNENQDNNDNQYNTNNYQNYEESSSSQSVEQQKHQQNNKIQIKSVSICVPDSIIQIAQVAQFYKSLTLQISLLYQIYKFVIFIIFPKLKQFIKSSELRSYFMSQIARTAAIFCVDEIIVLKDHSYKTLSVNFDSTGYVCRNLQYLETPQYLRKYLFPIHPDLKFTGLMNPIEATHHLKYDEFLPYREGVVVNRPVKSTDTGSWAEIGLKKQVKIDYHLQNNTRVTVKLQDQSLNIDQKHYTGNLVSQSCPMQNDKIYWGYTVRIANHVSELLKYTPYEEEYDLKICIGKKGKPVDIDYLKTLYQTQRILLVFGGHEGIEPIVEGDEKSKITAQTLDNSFDLYYCLNDDSLGVKALRVEEEIFQLLFQIKSVFKR